MSKWPFRHQSLNMPRAFPSRSGCKCAKMESALPVDRRVIFSPALTALISSLFQKLGCESDCERLPEYSQEHLEQLANSEFQFVQRCCGQTLKFDACCKDESGIDSKCSDWSSFGNVMEKDVVGKRVRLNALFADMPAYVQHYLSCKAKEPYQTSACIVVPKAAGH